MSRLAPLFAFSVLSVIAFVFPLPSPAQKASSLEELVSDFHELRLKFDEAQRNDAEIPPALTRRVRDVARAIGRDGPAGHNFLFARLSLESGELLGLIVEGLLASDEARVSQRLYREMQLKRSRLALGEEAFTVFFDQVPLDHLTVPLDDFQRFVNSSPPWRRNAIMTYLFRLQTPDSISYLLECPLVDRRDSYYDSDAVEATLSHFRTLLQELDSPPAIAAAAKALTEKPRYFAAGPTAFDVKVQTEVTVSLGELRHNDSGPVIAKKLFQKNSLLAVAAARALGCLQLEEFYAPLEKALAARKHAEFSLVALDALSSIDAGRTKEVLLRYTGSKDWRIRAVVVTGLGRVKSAETDELLLQFLTDDSWQVRKAAFEALATRPSRAFIGALIASLEKQRGALRARIYQALTVWTGQNLGPDPSAWQEFWKAHGAEFSLINKPVPKGRTFVDHGDPSSPRYFGLEIHSQDTAFVIDTSGSMRLSYLTRGPNDKVTSRAGIALVKSELWKTLEKLKEDQRFNIVSFPTGFQPLFKKPMKTTSKSRRAAARFLESMNARGATNIYDPLAHLILGGRVETLYLLSDGEPTQGRYTSPEVILREIARMNVYSHVTIHTFALGGTSEFLEELAAQNGGEYQRVDVSEVTVDVPDAPAHRNDPRRGDFETRFDERSPLSEIPQQVSRDRFNGRDEPDDYEISRQSWRVSIPPQYDGKQEFGLLVWIDPSDQGTIPYADVLAEQGWVGVSANGSGNGQSIWVRAGLALDAVHNMTKRFMIDKKRIYVAGFSGGGRMASRLGLMYADIFAGAMPIDGTDWWEDLPADESPGKWFQGRYQKPTGAIWRKAKKQNRYVLMTGERDGNRPGTHAAYRHGFQKAGFAHVVYVEVAGKGHEWPSARVFADGLHFLEFGKRR